MIGGFILAVEQLSDPAVRRVMAKSLLIALIIVVALLFAIGHLLSAISWVGWDWLDGMIAALGWFATLALMILFSPALLSIVCCFFLDEVAAAVEARHYPSLPPAREQSVAETSLGALRFVGASVLLNLLILPIYLIPVINVFVFYSVNGYLVGREYFELAAFRRLEPATARRLLARHRPRVSAAGALIWLLLSIPLVNLAMPVVATAFMVHVFEGIRLRSGGEI